MRTGPDRLTLTADAAIPVLAGLQQRLLVAGTAGAGVSKVKERLEGLEAELDEAYKRWEELEAFNV